MVIQWHHLVTPLELVVDNQMAVVAVDIAAVDVAAGSHTVVVVAVVVDTHHLHTLEFAVEVAVAAQIVAVVACHIAAAHMAVGHIVVVVGVADCDYLVGDHTHYADVHILA